jgi:lipoyl(octanoyl) transferase
VNGKKVAAIGIHISRWVTSHGFALNHTTDLKYFQYIVPCGLTKPITSMQELGSHAGREDVVAAVARQFAKHFQFELLSRDREDVVSSIPLANARGSEIPASPVPTLMETIHD